MRKVLLIGLVAFLFFLSITTWRALGYRGQDPVVAWVEGEPLAIGEFKMSLQGNKAFIVSYFNKTYGTNDGPDFWESSIEGEVPIKLLRQKALEESSRIKIQQLLARKEGIVEDISYDFFQSSLKAENRRREEALKSKEPIYGPKQYNEALFFDITFSELANQLKKRKHSAWEVTDADILTYYEANKDTEFSDEVFAVVNMIYIAIAKDGISTEMHKAAQYVRQKWEDGSEPKQLVTMASDKFDVKAEYREETFDKRSLLRNMKRWTKLSQEAQHILPGQISEVVEEREGLYILQGIKGAESRSVSLADVKERIYSSLRDAKYDRYIDKLTVEAHVEINGDVYEQITVR
ncbi:peptidylprolyl isomerase [Paenibacillus eucommiae]|uniref:PpiC domain-containing protein n=1 Tax=Paenibacillus eucommiae TaxID=1355755 RepID=A0ABS4ITC8_9BACL|nr:peptidylprolyl isomerase [Paenibacillus eucommiae]MBP1990825.1 hypothetical protein [Paenibacillus eucommiae]